MRLIDSHCHLDGFVKSGELATVLSRAAENGVEHFVSIGTNPEDCEVHAVLAKSHDNIDYTVGIHPIYAGNFQVVFDGFFVKTKKPCAIGEIGLDYHFLPEGDTRNSVICAQKHLFSEQLQLARLHNLPVVIHSRDAFDDTLEILVNSGIAADKVLFHCFAYSAEEMMRLKAFGTYVSFSGIVTYKSAASVREALKIADKDKILLETDCPFLAPVPFRGKSNEPAYISKTAAFVADFLDDHNLLERVFDNTVHFFNLKIK